MDVQGEVEHRVGEGYSAELCGWYYISAKNCGNGSGTGAWGDPTKPVVKPMVGVGLRNQSRCSTKFPMQRGRSFRKEFAAVPELESDVLVKRSRV